jgi:Mycoplasma protein of unknown function, DUF285
MPDATSFNQNLLLWDVSAVQDMRRMFEGATPPLGKIFPPGVMTGTRGMIRPLRVPALWESYRLER